MLLTRSADDVLVNTDEIYPDGENIHPDVITNCCNHQVQDSTGREDTEYNG